MHDIDICTSSAVSRDFEDRVQVMLAKMPGVEARAVCVEPNDLPQDGVLKFS